MASCNVVATPSDLANLPHVGGETVPIVPGHRRQEPDFSTLGNPVRGHTGLTGGPLKSKCHKVGWQHDTQKRRRCGGPTAGAAGTNKEQQGKAKESKKDKVRTLENLHKHLNKDDDKTLRYLRQGKKGK